MSRWFRRNRRLRLKANPALTAWIVAFHEERATAQPQEFVVPDRIYINRDGHITQGRP